jgi:hypothetical protein
VVCEEYRGIVFRICSILFTKSYGITVLLCTSIIFDEKRVQLDYDSKNIRKFIPKEQRRVDSRRKMSHLREIELMAG